MINSQLVNPASIAIIGASNEIYKPGGKVLKNLIDGGYQGKIYPVNPKENLVQGISCFQKIEDLPEVDLGIIAISAKYCTDAVSVLAHTKNTKAFIIISAGFSEMGHEGKIIENRLAEIVNKVNGVLIGPNCIGVITPFYKGVFTEPVPPIDLKGIDFISGSGATAVFIIDAGMKRGLRFANIFSVGNSAQIGVEEVLKYMDETFDENSSPRIKLLYLEDIRNPELLLKHASSLIKKGCSIAAIKAGSSDEGSRAASSHTGALATPDIAVDALFKKAGIVRCYGREELVNVAIAFTYPRAKGKNFAIITHAGGPAVMLTDSLSKNGLKVPVIDNEYSKFLLEELSPGSSVSNPIDFLATGTALQLGSIIEYVNKKFDEIDGMIVIFGTPGLFKIFDVYQLLHQKMENSRKPIYPVLPSEIVAKEEIEDFVSKGRCYFNDEVSLGNTLGKIYNLTYHEATDNQVLSVDNDLIRNTIENSVDGYLKPAEIQKLLDAVGILRAVEKVVFNESNLFFAVKEIGYPVVIKVVGPVHKTDVGGVTINIKDDIFLLDEFRRMMEIDGAKGVIIQPMLQGVELFVGAKYEKKYGHVIFCGLGGIFIEILHDVASCLAPLTRGEALEMIHSIKSYKLFEGVRGKKPVSKEVFIDILLRLSTLLSAAPEIEELDFNPLLADGDKITLVDARIKINKSGK